MNPCQYHIDEKEEFQHDAEKRKKANHTMSCEPNQSKSHSLIIEAFFSVVVPQTIELHRYPSSHFIYPIMVQIPTSHCQISRYHPVVKQSLQSAYLSQYRQRMRRYQAIWVLYAKDRKGDEQEHYGSNCLHTNSQMVC